MLGPLENIIQSNKYPQRGPVAKHKEEFTAFTKPKLLDLKIIHIIKQIPIKKHQKSSVEVKYSMD